jgi:hypothetical protein
MATRKTERGHRLKIKYMDFATITHYEPAIFSGK